MNPQLLWVLGLLFAAVALFIANRPRMDVVALLVIVALPLLGILSVQEALAGFSDPNVVLIAALFVIGEGLVRTGIAYRIGEWMADRAGNSEARLIVLLMVCVAGLGSVMSSTGVVAIFIPVVLSIAARMKVSPSRLMMPLAFAGLISGMLSLVATPPNVVVHSELVRHGESGFSFFSFTPFGLVVLLLGVGYMLLTRHWLGGEVRKDGSAQTRRTLLDLIIDYKLAGRERRLRVRPGSPLIGHSLSELKLRTEHGASVVGIERQHKFTTRVLSPDSSTTVHEGDVLLLDLFAPKDDLRSLCQGMQLEPLHFKAAYFIDQSQEVGMAEVAVPPGSQLIGKSLLELTFRSRWGLNVVGLRRDQAAIEEQLVEEKLKLGDTLLVIGTWKAIRQLQTQPRDFLVLSLPAEIDNVAPAGNRAPYALISLAVMVGLMVSGVVPNVIAALIGCLLMGAGRCIDMNSAYRAIHWQSLVLIVGMLPFALALQKTGGIALAVHGLVQMLGSAGPYVILASLFAITAIIGLFISNTATAVLMAPVAVTTAEQLGASPYPFAMIVALAASAAFMTPVSSPVNTLVLGPGQYRFGDFVKVGVPFTLLVMVASVIMVPWLFAL
ncbi:MULTISPECIES: SLC13 family permease [Pseudomonas]|uniref:SLC13 family permease n=1 Tax=Pseudomonas TaxID=286 RepID=UPI00029B2772|nr:MULTISPECIES: SLC13 family permease [Pseudomonas]MBF4207042.1 SLC13 family permease [Pseudomonas donghuensis]MBS7600600.1 SLC13 family permease [Pseudomonas sp. RC2C2]MCP6696315.1 SLC13 family permease [Pseudomonas donghuensis]PJY96859.1 cation transporter [Pseudomonas donghuensis]UVL26355.1 SLC13 family permease [Pseudomonas donghuensis]